MHQHFLGFGLGLRTTHFEEVCSTLPENIDWFEIISENFMVAGGKPKYYLHKIRERYPIVMHGVSLSIGSSDPLNYDYLKQLKVLVNEVNPPWFSDHLCWTGVHHVNSHDLLPLPYNEDTIHHIVQRIQKVQDFIGRPMLLENVSSYLTFTDSEMSEWEFYSRIVEEADCYMLLDINNIYVSARNHGFDPMDYLTAIPAHRVRQFHLAGHTDYGDYVIDTHDHDVPESVWSLFKKAWMQFGPVSTMIERDDDIPSLTQLIDELSIARNLALEISVKT